MDLHAASRGAALLFALISAGLVWLPPKGGLALEASKGTPLQNSGFEEQLSAGVWKFLFVCGVMSQTAFQVWVFQEYSGGLNGFLNDSWSIGDIVALASMGAAVKLRRSAYKQLGEIPIAWRCFPANILAGMSTFLGKYFTYKSVCLIH